MHAEHLQCPAALDEPSRLLARCQLMAGHHGPHALMFARNGRRYVRCWHRSDPTTVDDHPAAEETMPWVPGCPLPAWWEYPQFEAPRLQAARPQAPWHGASRHHAS